VTIIEARAIRTPNRLIWSQTRYRCAIAPRYQFLSKRALISSEAIDSAGLTAVGFEPTRIAPPELESGALDRSAKLSRLILDSTSLSQTQREIISRKEGIRWTHWDLNPGPSACEADVIPLHHEPDTLFIAFRILPCLRLEGLQ
jgi:hypothetical protein